MLNLVSRLMRSIVRAEEFIVVIIDTAGNIFGGFSSQKFELGSDFYGTGESFIFTWKGDQFEKYGCSMHNSFFVYSDAEGFGFGSE